MCFMYNEIHLNLGLRCFAQWMVILTSAAALAVDHYMEVNHLYIYILNEIYCILNKSQQ